jgi:hypothetical protein
VLFTAFLKKKMNKRILMDTSHSKELNWLKPSLMKKLSKLTKQERVQTNLKTKVAAITQMTNTETNHLFKVAAL